MKFQLLKIIIWPKKKGLTPRVVPFEPGMVNVISGASKTGKSAIIPIIDYCLASDSCTIPVGVIREACAWFGVVVETREGLKLFARKEPDQQRSTDYMYVLEGEFEVPDEIEAANTRAPDVRRKLDILAGVTDLEFDGEDASTFVGRPSFRDMMAFCFQPQNIIANPNVLFYKADTHEHRQKLRSVFPYALGAVTSEDMLLRAEAADLRRLLVRRQSALDAAKKSSEQWVGELMGWALQAQNLHFLGEVSLAELGADSLMDLLRPLIGMDASVPQLSTQGNGDVNSNEFDLEREEADLSAELALYKSQLRDIQRLDAGSREYSDTLKVQHDRLSVAKWLKGQMKEDIECPICSSSMIEQRFEVDQLLGALEEIESANRQVPKVTAGLDRQKLALAERIRTVVERINALKLARDDYKAERSRAGKFRSLQEERQRFLGRLEQAFEVYDRTIAPEGLTQEVFYLNKRLEDIARKVSEGKVISRLRDVKKQIEKATEAVVRDLDAEWPEAPIDLKIDDLTLTVNRRGRQDYLWEIGSGANWVAYHVGITVALQSFFSSREESPVPSFLVFDQPSQVYFPRRATLGESQEEDVEWRDEDIAAVRKIFIALAKALAAGEEDALQFIVLDHAGYEVWGDIEGVTLSREWRGEKLVPDEWF